MRFIKKCILCSKNVSCVQKRLILCNRLERLAFTVVRCESLLLKIYLVCRTVFLFCVLFLPYSCTESRCDRERLVVLCISKQLVLVLVPFWLKLLEDFFGPSGSTEFSHRRRRKTFPSITENLHDAGIVGIGVMTVDVRTL